MPQEEAGEAEAVVVGRVRVDLAEEPDKELPQDLVKPINLMVPRITMPMHSLREWEAKPRGRT